MIKIQKRRGSAITLLRTISVLAVGMDTDRHTHTHAHYCNPHYASSKEEYMHSCTDAPCFQPTNCNVVSSS